MNNEITNKVSSAIMKTLREILSKNSTIPQFRDAWLASTRNIAERYVRGEIAKEEMEREYDERKGALVRWCYLALITNETEVSEIIARDYYEKLRAM